jgi:hypothetical protein
VSLEGLPPAHLRVLLDGLPVFERYGLLLAGGYAFRAHKILHRPSQDLDFATRDDTPLPEIAAHVQLAFQRAGYDVRLAEAASARYARLVLRLPGSGEELEMDLLKEALEPRWVTAQITLTASVRAVSLEDTVGLKTRAWHDRFVIRDIIDLHAVAGTFSYAPILRTLPAVMIRTSICQRPRRFGRRGSCAEGFRTARSLAGALRIGSATRTRKSSSVPRAG